MSASATVCVRKARTDLGPLQELGVGLEYLIKVGSVFAHHSEPPAFDLRELVVGVRVEEEKSFVGRQDAK